MLSNILGRISINCFIKAYLRVNIMEQRTDGKHTLMLEKRGKMTLTGVLEVISFDEMSIIADTDCGVLVIKGDGLHIDSLNLEKGDMTLDGNVDSIVYEDSFSAKGSFFGKLFR